MLHERMAFPLSDVFVWLPNLQGMGVIPLGQLLPHVRPSGRTPVRDVNVSSDRLRQQSAYPCPLEAYGLAKL